MENNNKPKQPNKPPKKVDKKKEELSREDWLDIMGVNRPTYKRVNGAWRRR